MSGRSPLLNLEKELAELESKLRISTIPSSSALLPVLVMFEARLTELEVLELGRVSRPHHPTMMSLRYQYEDALSKVVRVAIARGGMPQSLDISLNRSRLEAACEAWTFELTYDIIRRYLDASRFSLVEIESDDSRIVFKVSKHMQKIHEYETALSLRDMRIEEELATSRMNEKLGPTGSADWWYSFLMNSMKDQGFRGNEWLESCSILEYTRIWSALMNMSYRKNLRGFVRYQKIFTGKKLRLDELTEFLFILPAKQLVQRVAEQTNLDGQKINGIIDLLTFRSLERDEIFIRPIIRVGNIILFLPHVISNNFVFRNLRRRLAIEQPANYRSLARELGNNFQERIVDILRKAGYEVRSSVKLKNDLGRGITDIDILAYKSNLLIVAQLKNIAASDSSEWKEVLRAFRDASEGISQLKTSVSYIREHFSEVMKDYFPTEAAHDRVKVIPVLVTGVKIEHVFKDIDIPILDLYGFQQCVNESSVETLWDLEKRVPDIHIARKFLEQTMEGQVGRFYVKMKVFFHPIHTDQIGLRGDKVFSFEERFDLRHLLDDIEHT